LESCAIFDVLLPPYNPDSGRHCQYYLDTSREVSQKLDSSLAAFPNGEFSVPVETKLQEIEEPEDFYVENGGTYNFQLVE